MTYRDYLQSNRWRCRRYRAITLSDFRCELCGRRGSNSPYGRYGLEVHHLSYARLGDEPDDDLLVLCSDCHSDIHGFARAVVGFTRIDSLLHAEVKKLRRLQERQR